MQRTFAAVIATLSLLAVVVQFLLMMNNRTAAMGETVIRFFSFFTILTNTLVAAYFTYVVFRPMRASILTAVTVYIIVVGLVYQVTLRHLWQPTGWQRIVDELLHSIVPLLVLMFWMKYGWKETLMYRHAIVWLLYPAIYLVFVLLRGSFSNFYPYPFLDVSKIGYTRALINCGFVTALFLLLSCLFIYLGRKQGTKTSIRSSRSVQTPD